MARTRCAIYTRKSSEEGLDQDFNSLDAQYEACASYVASQRHEGWVLVKERYDDGGISGGHLDRPALQRLMDDVEAGRVNRIVVYKIDRLTRSLTDFAKLVERLDGAGASFVSVTQSFNTATSMGRLTLNVLLSFAQFEREVTAERIKDKIAASKAKGLWMGGNVPLGYEAENRTLRIVPEEAETVRTLFDLYEQLGTVTAVTRQAAKLGLRSKRRAGEMAQDAAGLSWAGGRSTMCCLTRSMPGAFVTRIRSTTVSTMRSSIPIGLTPSRLGSSTVLLSHATNPLPRIHRHWLASSSTRPAID